jgi:protein-S-isoprenylcysteine O-methyltransferase Ste14
LGDNLSINPRIRGGHQMVTEGVYSIVRHPMYLTTTLFALALPFLLLNYVASFPFLIIPVGLYYRSKKEEQL